MIKPRASIDIGSNSILLLIATVDDKEITVLESESRVTALGFELDKAGAFHVDSLKNSFDALKEYRDIIQSHDIELSDVVITATEASRVAKNAKDFFSKVLNELGLKVTIITGEAEAYYSAKGILFDIELISDDLFILDIGGASSEVIKVDSSTRDIISSFSMPFGAVRATNWAQEKSLDKEFKKVFNLFSNEIFIHKTKKIFCVAGTMTSVANIHLNHKEFIEKNIHGFKMSKGDVLSQLKKLKGKDCKQILNLYPFLGKRAKTIVGGLEVACAIFEMLGVEDIEISTYGLRYGTLLTGGIKNEFIHE